jgi:hypothetical protein
MTKVPSSRSVFVFRWLAITAAIAVIIYLFY